MTNEELAAMLAGTPSNVLTDTQALQAGMSGTSSGAGVGRRSDDARTAEEMYAAGEQARKEAGGSMGLADEYAWQDPRPHLDPEQSEAYLTGESKVRMPPQGGQPESEFITFGQKHELGTKPPGRAPASMRVASQITNQDILDMAQSGEFPDDLEHPKEDMDRRWTPSAVPLKQIYSQIEDPLDRAVFLRDRRDKVAKQRFTEIYNRELMPKLGEAAAVGVAVGSLGTLALLAPSAVALLGGMSRNQLANLAVDAGVDLAFDGAALYLFYDYINSDDDAEKAELEAKFDELKKEVGGIKKGKDSGSPPIAGGTSDTGPKKGKSSFKENPDGSIDF